MLITIVYKMVLVSNKEPDISINFDYEVKFTEEEKNWIKKHPVLRVGVLKNAFPYQFCSDDGEFRGISSIYIDNIQNKSGVKFILVYFDSVEQAVDAINNGEIDVFSLSLDEEKHNGKISFSKPYLTFNSGIFTTKENILYVNAVEDLQKQKIAISEGAKLYTYFSPNEYDVTIFNTPMSAIRAVSREEYSAYVGDVFYTKNILDKFNIDNLFLASLTDDRTHAFSFAVTNKYKGFVPVINRILGKLDSGAQYDIIKEWIGANVFSEQNLSDEYKNNLIILTSIFSIFVLIIYINNIKLKRKTNQLNELRATYRRLLEKAPVPAVILKEDKIFHLNEAAEEFAETKEDKVIGAEFFQYIDKDYVDIAFRQLNDDKEAYKRDVKIYTAKGNLRYVNMRKIDLSMHGEPIELITMIDVTERKKLEEEKRKMLEKTASIQKMETVGMFAGRIAHDFNNILTGIKGAAEFMNESLANKSPLKKYPQIIMNACTRAAFLTRQLLVFSKNKTQIMKVVNLNSFIKESVALLEQAIRQDSKIKVISKLKSKSKNIHGNENLIESMIINLGLNSKDALKGKGKIVIETKDVKLTKKDIKKTVFEDVNPGDFVELSIADNGEGMSDEVKKQIFAPFFTTKDSEKGTGLGLMSVYNTVRDHSATIKLESSQGVGTKFSIYFPITDEKISSRKIIKNIKDIAAKILVIDDEEILMELIKDILEKFGAEVLTAKNYDEALHIYKKEVDIDLVLLDLIMPDKGGIEVYRALKEINQNIKAIFVSGYSKDKELGTLLSNNENIGFIAKPYNIVDVIDEISILLAK